MSPLFLLPFHIAGQRLAVAVQAVRRVLPALNVTPLPGAPALVQGVVEVRGRVLPVVDLARRLGWPTPATTLWQPYLWLQTSRRELVIPVDDVAPVADFQPESFLPATDPAVPSQLLHGVVRSADGLLLIQDVEQLLSLDDEVALAAALAQQAREDDAHR